MKWFAQLRQGFNAPFGDTIDLSADEKRWWAAEEKRELRRTRWVRICQSLAAALGPALPNLVRDPAQLMRPSYAAMLCGTSIVIYLLFGRLSAKITVRAAKKELVPRHRLRNALLADLATDEIAHAPRSAQGAEGAAARRLESHDVT